MNFDATPGLIKGHGRNCRQMPEFADERAKRLHTVAGIVRAGSLERFWLEL
jgi:hypothetical protein